MKDMVGPLLIQMPGPNLQSAMSANALVPFVAFGSRKGHIGEIIRLDGMQLDAARKCRAPRETAWPMDAEPEGAGWNPGNEQG
jgi:hypothetical protein